MWKSSDDSRDGDWVSVQSRLVESFMNCCVELRLSSSGQERIQLD